MRRILFCLLFIVASLAFAAPVTLTRKVIVEVIEAGAKKSGRVLTPAARQAAEKALVQAGKRYGDDVVARVVKLGGLEALEQGARHGKIFWQLCSQTPKAARSLALHADELLPIAKRIGPDFMKLEARMPGMARKAVECFGDDAARALAKMPPDDAAKLIRFGTRADSPQTVRMLLEGYQKSSGRILRHLDGKRIVALGLSASIVTAAYKVSNGVEEGIVGVATNSPEHFTGMIGRPLLCATVCAFLFLAWFAFPVRRWLGARLATKTEKAVTGGGGRKGAEEAAQSPQSAQSPQPAQSAPGDEA